MDVICVIYIYMYNEARRYIILFDVIFVLELTDGEFNFH